MTDTDIETVEEGVEYIQVRFRDPDEFEEIRTPEWAEDAASSVSDGAEVRTGKQKNSDEWEVQSVLIESDEGKDTAREQAREIADKIE